MRACTTDAQRIEQAQTCVSLGRAAYLYKNSELREYAALVMGQYCAGVTASAQWATLELDDPLLAMNLLKETLKCVPDVCTVRSTCTTASEAPGPSSAFVASHAVTLHDPGASGSSPALSGDAPTGANRRRKAATNADAVKRRSPRTQ